MCEVGEFSLGRTSSEFRLKAAARDQVTVQGEVKGMDSRSLWSVVHFLRLEILSQLINRLRSSFRYFVGYVTGVRCEEPYYSRVVSEEACAIAVEQSRMTIEVEVAIVPGN